MPGRHGKQVKKRNRSKRAPATEMETTLKDSIHNRTRKERAILKDLVPPAVTHAVKKVSISNELPMFSAPKSNPATIPTRQTPSRNPKQRKVKVRSEKTKE